MINIASLYYFTLLQRLSPKYKKSLNTVIGNIKQYLKEESLGFLVKKKTLGEYELVSFIITDVGVIHLFHRNKREKNSIIIQVFFVIYILKKNT